jgi:hypothetical protein
MIFEPQGQCLWQFFVVLLNLGCIEVKKKKKTSPVFPNHKYYFLTSYENAPILLNFAFDLFVFLFESHEQFFSIWRLSPLPVTGL